MPSPRSEPLRTFETASEAETRRAGEQIAALLPVSAVVTFEGDLGAGKTTLIAGIAEGRGAEKASEVSSPTFALIHEYGDPVGIYHVDLYRLETLAQASRIGLEELFERPGLTLIEWGERFPELLPEDRWRVRLAASSITERRIELYAPASRATATLSQAP